MARTFEQKYDEIPDDEDGLILRQFIFDNNKSVRVMLPCEIVFISPDYKTVNLKILDKDIDNAGNIIDYPIVTNCPIKHPAETGQAYIHLPPSIGDQGKIEFFDSSVDEMFVLDNPVYDDNEEWHHLSNGLYTSGFSSKSKSFAVDNTAPITIGLKNSTFTFKVNSAGELVVTGLTDLKFKSNTSVIIDSPDVVTTGNLMSGTGYSGTVACGSKMLTFDGGICTNAE